MRLIKFMEKGGVGGDRRWERGQADEENRINLSWHKQCIY